MAGRSRAWTIAALMASTCVGAAARADDRRAPPKEADGLAASEPSEVSEDAARARRAFEGERWAEAAIGLHRVSSGETQDTPEARQIAEFDLAIALFRLDLHLASFAVFSDIAATPTHARFDATLPWLARLAEILPEPAEVAERVGKYGSKALARFDHPETKALYSELNYLVGRYDYSARNFEDAIDCLMKVDADSRWYLEARFFSGVSNVSLRKSAPAAQAFLDVESALDAGTPKLDDAERLRDLGYLSLARTYYSAAAHIDDRGVPVLDAKKLSAAVGYWNKIDLSSEYWLDAQFEEAWAYFMAGDSARSLGNVHTIQAPYFNRMAYPEADVLRAVVYYSSCRYEDATTVAAGAIATYSPLRKALVKVIEDRQGGDDRDQQFFDLLRLVREGGTALGAEVTPLVRQALGDRELLRNVDYVSVLDAERARFDAMPASFRTSSAGVDAADAIDLAKVLAIRKAGSLAHDRLEEAKDQLDEQLRNAQKVLIDVTDQQRLALEEGARPGAQKPPTQPIEPATLEADSEHEKWPFDGEYWRDELGTYREDIHPHCR